MTTASWNGTVIASSDSTVGMEGNDYFPLSSVTDGVLVESDTPQEAGRGHPRPCRLLEGG